jgi:hypothetical protein
VSSGRSFPAGASSLSSVDMGMSLPLLPPLSLLFLPEA